MMECICDRGARRLLAVGTAGMVMAGAASAQNDVIAPPAGPAPWITAQRVDIGGPIHGSGRDYDIPRPNHPPIDQIQPMPMPDGSNWEPGPLDPAKAQLVGPDPLTGGVVPLGWDENPFGDIEGAQGGGYDGADGGFGDSEPNLRTFVDMYRIFNEDEHPWRMNVKMVMRFEDGGGGSHWFVASGYMADAEVVMTAGHCVYSQTYGWAREIWVYPGHSASDDPYGYGYASYPNWVSTTGWTSSGDFDYDTGMMILDRSVGMLTGWFGWAWGFSCSTIQGRTYNNTSYPAESCGGGLHNGDDMYYWYGNFDSCPGNQLQIDTGGGCFQAVWGGMSGSGAYYIDGGSRYQHAVCSNSNRSTIGRYPKFWESWIDYMNNTWIPAARGSSFDIQALDTNASPTSVTAGQALTNGDHLAANATNANPGSAQFWFNTYLSTNDNISTADTQLGRWTYTYDFAAMSSVRIGNHADTIPVGASGGTRWYGVVYDNGTDADDANNDTDGWDAAQITVVAVADPYADSVNAANGTHYHGDSFNVSYTVINQGYNTANSVVVEVRASSNTIISSADTLLTSTAYGSLSGSGGTINDTVSVVSPAALTGDYYIGIIVSASNDAYTGNNTDYDPTTVHFEPQPGCGTLTPVGAFAGNRGETWEGFPNYNVDPDFYMDDPTVIMGGAARISHSLMVIYEPGAAATFGLSGNGSAQVTDGTKGHGVNTGTTTTTIEFLTPVSRFGGYWGAAGSPPATSDIVFDFYDPTGCLIGSETLAYVDSSASGTLMWAGWSSNLPISRVQYTAYYPVNDGLQATLACRPDFNGDGILNSQDFIAFLNAFTAGDPSADYNGDGTVNSQDFIAFLNDFVAGC